MEFSWRFLLLLGALTIPTCGYANPSFDYAISGPMVFRNGFNGGNCNGCEWIIAEGTIQPDTPDVFKEFLLRKKVSGGISVKFNSPGGSLLAGVRLGEMIRAAGLFSEVGKTIGEESSFDPETIEEKTRADARRPAFTHSLVVTGSVIMAPRSSAVLHPALKYEGEIYMAPLKGQHLDALPKHLADDFHQKAMNGEDISKFNFGFINDKGDFLNREDALKYAIDEGLLHPNDARYVTLTSAMLVRKS